MIGLLGSILKDGLGLVADSLKGKREVKKASDENTARLLRETTKANSAWEVAQLKQADKWARRFVLALFATPVVITVADPVRGKAIWENFSLVPVWFQGAFVAICFATWGLRQATTWADHKQKQGALS